MEKHLEEVLALSAKAFEEANPSELLADFLEFNKQCEMSLTQITDIGYELEVEYPICGASIYEPCTTYSDDLQCGIELGLEVHTKRYELADYNRFHNMWYYA